VRYTGGMHSSPMSWLPGQIARGWLNRSKPITLRELIQVGIWRE